MKNDIVIIGAGVAGLGVAAELARRGHPVTLLEAEDHLGGHAARWACMATDRCQRCGVCLVHDLVAEVQASPLVTLLVGHRVVGVAPEGRLSHVTAHSPGGAAVSLEADTLVLATGFEPFDPTGARPIGASELAGAVTTVDLDDALRADDLESLALTGDDDKRIAFLQCVGSRDPEAGRPYCSQVCCEGALRFARRLLHLRPGWSITIFYIDLQAHGKEARTRFLDLAPNLRLVQGVPAEIRPPADPANAAGAVAFQGSDGKMRLEAFDGFVLTVGMVPAPDTAGLVSRIPGLELGLGGFLRPAIPGGDAGEAGASGAVDANAGARVYAVGTCQGPTSIEGSLVQAKQVAGAILAGRPATKAASARSASAEPARVGIAAAPFAFQPHALTVEPEPDLAPASAASLADPVPVRRTVAVLGEGAEANLVISALETAALPVTRLSARAPDGGPAWNRLSGSLGRFTLRRCREGEAGDASATRAHPGADFVRAGAVVLAPGPAYDPPHTPLDGDGPAVPFDAHPEPPGDGPWGLWLDPDGPAWRPDAAEALEAATRAAEAGQEVSVLARHVPLPGLNGQQRYDAFRQAGGRLLRLDDDPPTWRSPDAAAGGAGGAEAKSGATLRLRDAAAPESHALLPLAQLSVLGPRRPPADLSESLSIRTDREGFAQTGDVRLEPIATNRVGIHAFGSARGEALPEELEAEAAALALELRSLLGGEVLQWAPAAIEIDPGRCTRCLTCVRTCPHHALEVPENQGAPPRIDPVACQACGQCRANCPARAIHPRGAPPTPRRELPCPLTELEASAPHPPRQAPPRVAVLACQHSGAPALHEAIVAGLLEADDISLRVLPCGGAADEVCLLDALRSGARRVAVLTCHPGSCAHHDGPGACTRRVESLTPLLRQLGLPEETLVQLPLAPAEGPRLAHWLDEILATTPEGVTP